MPSRPNVLFILTDQQRHDTIAALGHPHCITPHLDKLVEEGVSFTQCHVTAPSCAPLGQASSPVTTPTLPGSSRMPTIGLEAGLKT